MNSRENFISIIPMILIDILTYDGQVKFFKTKLLHVDQNK